MRSHTIAMWVFWIWMMLLLYLDIGYRSTYHPLSLILSTVLIFIWFLSDAKENRFRISAWLKISVIMLAFAAVPYYLIRYKGIKRSGLSLLKFSGFLALLFAYDNVLIFLTLPHKGGGN